MLSDQAEASNLSTKSTEASNKSRRYLTTTKLSGKIQQGNDQKMEATEIRQQTTTTYRNYEHKSTKTQYKNADLTSINTQTNKFKLN